MGGVDPLLEVRDPAQVISGLRRDLYHERRKNRIQADTLARYRSEMITILRNRENLLIDKAANCECITVPYSKLSIATGSSIEDLQEMAKEQIDILMKEHNFHVDETDMYQAILDSKDDNPEAQYYATTGFKDPEQAARWESMKDAIKKDDVVSYCEDIMRRVEGAGGAQWTLFCLKAGMRADWVMVHLSTSRNLTQKEIMLP